MVIELVALIYWLLQSIIIYLNRLCCPSLTRRPHRLALNLQVLLSRQTLNRTNNTLHLIGIVSAKSFVLILLFSIFIDPLCPIHLDILIFWVLLISLGQKAASQFFFSKTKSIWKPVLCHFDSSATT